MNLVKTVGTGIVAGLAVIGLVAVVLAASGVLTFEGERTTGAAAEPEPLQTPEEEQAAAEAEADLLSEGGSAEGDAYCTGEKEDELAALEIGSEDTINSPRLLRRATGRFLRENADAPAGASCVEAELEFLIDVWNGNRGDDRYPEAAEQVRELRKFERRE